MLSLPDHLLAFMQRSPGIVAVSGGPDSVALAHLLRHTHVTFAHFNHRLRGAESDADEAFVRDLPRLWASEQIGVRVWGADTATEATRAGQNLEAFARDRRYAWLVELARAEGAGWVATGHTANDQAETILFRLLRGSGLDGLRAMSESRPLADGIALVRPLLTVSREAVQRYLEENGLAFRQDTSNLDLRLTRNRIRRELIPHVMEKYNPAVVDVLCRLARQADEVQQEMHRIAAELLAAAELPRAGSVLVFRADVLEPAAPVRVREMFRLVWRREGWPESDMGFAEWQRLVEIAAGRLTAWDFPGGMRARRVGRVMQIDGSLKR